MAAEDKFHKDISQELENMDERLSNLEQKVTTVEGKVDMINNKLSTVIEAIIGNGVTKKGGLVEELSRESARLQLLEDTRIAALEAKVTKLENFYQRVLWTAGLIIGTTIVIQYVIQMYKDITSLN